LDSCKIVKIKRKTYNVVILSVTAARFLYAIFKRVLLSALLLELLHAHFPDSVEIADSVGSENKVKDFRDKVIELFAVFEILEVGAVGTGNVTAF
jgi:hypothetical protein